MKTALRLGRLEIRLFLREPLTVLFSLALPIIILFVLGGVFGTEPAQTGEDVVFRGVAPMSYYVPAYVALVIASVCVISIPTHLAGNRERGVLKRFHASSLTAQAVVGSQLIVAFVLSIVSSVMLLVAARLLYEFDAPDSVPAVVGAFVFLTLGFAAFGILLGAVLPTARAAQAVGMLVWFVMLFLGGAGPPPEVLTGAMTAIANATPLLHAVRVMQDAWLGLDAGLSWFFFAGFLIFCVALAVRFFRWE